MGLIKAFSDALTGTLADQWKDIITAAAFNERSVVVPGIHRDRVNGRGINANYTPGIITNGSIVSVPENTAAFVFSQGRIDNILTDPGEYEYIDGEQGSIFNGESVAYSIIDQVKHRFSYGGISPTQKKIAFVNLREIRDIKFGTRSPLLYNDHHYGVDIGVVSRGSFSIRVTDPEVFITNFVPPDVLRYSFDEDKPKAQLVSDFLQSFSVALNLLSQEYRIAELTAHANEIAEKVMGDTANAGTWPERFGLAITKVSIESIDIAPDYKDIVQTFAENRIRITAYENISQKASNISAQQKIAQGVQNHGLGSMPGMVVGMDLARSLSPQTEVNTSLPIDQQIEMLKKMKELLDLGVLTQEEFDLKKKEVLGL